MKDALQKDGALTLQNLSDQLEKIEDKDKVAFAPATHYLKERRRIVFQCDEAETLLVNEIEKFPLTESHSEYKELLQDLNKRLQPYNMHFAFRIFDEIIMFMSNAEENGLDLKDAFDQAVLMKVLPKFHGPRSKLEKPLQAVLCWCAGVATKDQDPVMAALANPEASINASEWKYPATVRRVLRMVHSLNTTGFASFG